MGAPPRQMREERTSIEGCPGKWVRFVGRVVIGERWPCILSGSGCMCSWRLLRRMSHGRLDFLHFSTHSVSCRHRSHNECTQSSGKATMPGRLIAWRKHESDSFKGLGNKPTPALIARLTGSQTMKPRHTIHNSTPCSEGWESTHRRADSRASNEKQGDANYSTVVPFRIPLRAIRSMTCCAGTNPAIASFLERFTTTPMTEPFCT